MLQMQCNSFTVKPIDRLKQNTYVPGNQSANQTEKSNSKISGFNSMYNTEMSVVPDCQILK